MLHAACGALGSAALMHGDACRRQFAAHPLQGFRALDFHADKANAIALCRLHQHAPGVVVHAQAEARVCQITDLEANIIRRKRTPFGHIDSVDAQITDFVDFQFALLHYL